MIFDKSIIILCVKWIISSTQWKKKYYSNLIKFFTILYSPALSLVSVSVMLISVWIRSDLAHKYPKEMSKLFSIDSNGPKAIVPCAMIGFLGFLYAFLLNEPFYWPVKQIVKNLN